MRILMFSEVYPPASAVGTQRAARLVETFVTEGHTVHLITADHPRRGEDYHPAAQATGRLTLHPVTPWRGLIDRVREWRGRWKATKGGAGASPDGAPAPVARPEPATFATPPLGIRVGVAASPGGRLRAKVRFALREMIRIFDHVPDHFIGFIPPAVRQAYRLRHERFDLVYATAPGFSVHLAARLASIALGVPLVLEFRDPWVGNAFFQPTDLPPLAGRIARAMEAWCLRGTSLVVTVTNQARWLYERRLTLLGLAIDVECYLNGIATLSEARAPGPPGDPLKLVYAGSLYGAREPAPLFRAMAQLRTDPTAPRFTLVLLGTAPRSEERNLADEAAAAGLGDSVEFRPWVAVSKVRSELERADVLLLLAERLVVQVPNKLYDYLGTRAPILAIGEARGEVAELLLGVGGHQMVETGDSRALEEALRKSLERARQRVAVGNEAELRRLLASEQMRLLTASLVRRFGGAARAS